MKALENRQMNFLQELNQKEKVSHKGAIIKVILVMTPILLVVVCAGLFIFIKVMTAASDIQTELMHSELYSEEFLQRQAAMELLQDQIADLKEYNDNYDRAVNYINGIPELDSDILDSILGVADGEVKISHMNYDGKGITLDLGTNQYKQSVLFVERLEELDCVESVRYVGFSSLDTDFSEYEFPVYIMLKGGSK